jgi:hypothetical protein
MSFWKLAVFWSKVSENRLLASESVVKVLFFSKIVEKIATYSALMTFSPKRASGVRESSN